MAGILHGKSNCGYIVLCTDDQTGLDLLLFSGIVSF